MILTSESTARLPLLDAMLPAGARFGLVGKSDALKRVFDLMDQVGPTDATILITGETGTGKEIVARGIHQLSPRAKAPFLCCNCPAIPESLVESELFGYSKGAFTGAYAQQDGLITQANGGTLFFDELGEMNPLAQAKILRTLETGEVQPLGSSKTVHVEVRLISATHRNLGQMVAENSFRRDLLFRVNAVELHLPPLRERKEDIPLLIDHFIDVFNREHASGPQGRDPVAGVTPGAMRLLCGHDWPGNIRQLRNVIEGAFLLAPGPWISVQDLCQLHWSLGSPARHQYTVSSSAPSYQHISNEPDRLLAALQATRWNKSKTAEILHWSRMTVYRKIARYGLEP